MHKFGKANLHFNHLTDWKDDSLLIVQSTDSSQLIPVN